MTYEAPKKYTAINDITGALIKSKGTNQEAYASGWDVIFNKKNKCEWCSGEGLVGGLKQDGWHTEECTYCEGTGLA